MNDDPILIIGAGFAGIGLGIRLLRAGITDFIILERGDDVGGVWRDNRYPGAACDVKSHLYSFSFEPNPDWSREYAPQAEILAYLRRCAEKHGLLEHVRFGTSVEGARYDETTHRWDLETSRGTFRGRVLVLGIGGLNRPSFPTLPGQEAFAGTTFHTAMWDAKAKLEGKRVGIVGTGASAIQVVPNIASNVEHLTVFQRTASWILPKDDGEIPESRRARFRQMPLLRRLERLGIYWGSEARVLPLVKRPDIMQKHAEPMALKYLEATVRDPKLREKLTPKYRMGCKRILLSNDYYPALCRENVNLVTEPIQSVDGSGIRTTTEHHPLDVIIYATGFHTGDAGAPFNIVGKGGRTLDDAWSGGIEAYLAATVSGFPNMFFICGPNSGLSHSSMIFMIESSINYVVDALETMRRRGIAAVDVRADVMARYNADLARKLTGTVWDSGCASWYLDQNGRNVALWPGFTFEFRRRTRHFDAKHYALVPKTLDAPVDTGEATSTSVAAAEYLSNHRDRQIAPGARAPLSRARAPGVAPRLRG
jgi:cation diffusion facilitator CzcD-associated flavoprotein CzcO